MPLSPELLRRVQASRPDGMQIGLAYQALKVEDVTQLARALAASEGSVELDLTGNLLGDACIAILAACPPLQLLHLSGNEITDTALSPFTHNKSCRTLDLSYNRITDAGILHLLESEGVGSLSLDGNNIIIADKFASSTRLAVLSLRSNEINSVGVQQFEFNTSLLTLALDNNLIGAGGAAALSRNLALRELSLDDNCIMDEGASALAATCSTSLMSLSLAYNQIGDSGAAAFREASFIATLDLTGNRINSTGISALAQSRSLTSLRLAFNQVDDHAIAVFAENQTLLHLDMSYNQITAAGVRHLSRMRQLQNLALNYNTLADEGATVLAAMQLTTLELAGNNITFEGASALADNATITSLVLSANSLQDAGAMLLAHNSTLRTLMLCYNNIGNAGAIMLAKNRTLTALNLNYNPIDIRGKSALEANSHLSSLAVTLDQAPGYTTDRLQLLFTFTQNMFCILGLDGKLHFCNPAFLRRMGYHDHEILGKTFMDLLHPADRLDNHPLAKLSQKFPAVNLDNRMLCKVKSYRIIRWNSQLRGEFIYSACTDITEQKKAEREYLRLQREAIDIQKAEAHAYSRRQTEFIASLSHEVRNPLSGVLSATELMQTELAAGSSSGGRELSGEQIGKMSRDLEDVKQCVSYVIEVLDGNLDLAKISEKKLVLQREPCDLAAVIRDVISMCKADTAKKALSLELHEAHRELWITMDALRVKQIVMNLVKNAIKFTEAGTVRVAWSVLRRDEKDTEWELRVHDSGIGMMEEEMQHLFTPFSQANLSTGAHYGGFGMGLFLSQRLANLMGGKITAESRQGEGSTFALRISCGSSSAPRPPSSASASSSAPCADAHRKAVVLVVEDNVINRRLMCRLLGDTFVCLEAENGVRALEQLQQHPVDVILMDMMMPVMDGLEATKAIRKRERDSGQRSKVPIIALSANVLQRDIALATSAGVDAYVAKPYRRDEIIRAIHEAIGAAAAAAAPPEQQQVTSLNEETKCSSEH